MEQTSPLDADLVTRTLAGNRESFGQLYDRYARVVRAVVTGVSGDWSAVEDMTQECFFRAYRNLKSLHDAQRFGSWIVGIARRVGRERRRSLRRDRHRFSDAKLFSVEAYSAMQGIQDAEEIAVVMNRLAELPEKEPLAIHAFFSRIGTLGARLGCWGIREAYLLSFDHSGRAGPANPAIFSISA
jgi:RNA polymerase sigma factor (sigma-70 family)